MTKTEKLFQDAIKVSAEVVKMINEDDYDLEDKNIIDLNDKVSNIQCELLDLPMDFEIKNRKDYCKKLLGKDYFSDNRCWDYLNDVVYEIENDTLVYKYCIDIKEDMPIFVNDVEYTYEEFLLLIGAMKPKAGSKMIKSLSLSTRCPSSTSNQRTE